MNPFNNLNASIPKFLELFTKKSIHPRNVDKILPSLALTYDTVYDSVSKYSEAYSIIEMLSKYKKLAGVVFHTDQKSGYPLKLSKDFFPNAKTYLSSVEKIKELSSSLNKIEKNGAVLFIGDRLDLLRTPVETPGILGLIESYFTYLFKPSIAQKIADLSQRRVVVVKGSIVNFNKPLKTDPLVFDDSSIYVEFFPKE